MKTKRKILKLNLTRETLRRLEEDQIRAAAGAISFPAICPATYPATRCLTTCRTGEEC